MPEPCTTSSTDKNAILRCGNEHTCPKLSDKWGLVAGIKELVSTCPIDPKDKNKYDNTVCKTSPGKYRYYKWVDSNCQKAQVVKNFTSGECINEDGTNLITYVIPSNTPVPPCDKKGSIYDKYDGGGKSSSSLIWIIALIALLLIVGGIVYMVYSHKKQKKGGNSFNNPFYTQLHFSS